MLWLRERLNGRQDRAGGADTRLVKVRDGSDAANDRSKFQPSCVRVSFPSGHIGPIIEELMDR